MGRAALRRFLLALGLLGGLSLLPAHAGSLVWAVHGAHCTLYLAGSVHLLPKNDAQLPPAFERAYTDSSRLIMELDLGKVDSAATSAWMQAHGTLGAGADLRATVGNRRYARVRQAAEELGLPLPLLDTQAPWVVGLELAELEYVHLGFDPEQGVEEQLVRRAQADGKTLAGLETLQQELGGLEALTPAEQLRLLDQTLDELKDSPAEMRAILAAWRRGDAGKLGKLLADEYQDFPALYRTLVRNRNERWLPQIEELLRGDQNCLIVVGALHLVGEGGLLELLRRDGFMPSPLP
jgi:uncharacterized protein